MRGVLATTASVAFFGLGAGIASCASHGGDEGREAVASTRQAVHGAVMRGSARKVCQLIGDTDFETGLPTLSQSASRFGVSNTDLGYPVGQGNRTWFFFGDISNADDMDPLGFTDDKPDPNDPTKCPRLRFSVPGGNAGAQALTLRCNSPRLSGPLNRGGAGFNVPTGFVFDPVGNRLLGHFVFGLGSNDPSKMTVTLAEASLGPGGSPKDFTCIPSVLSNLPAQYSMIAPAIADVNELGYGNVLPGAGSQVLLVWGTGIPYRETGVRLAAVRLNEVRNASMWRFFHASTNEWLATPQPPRDVNDKNDTEPDAIASPARAGELSVSFDPALREWRMVHGLSSAALNPAEQGQLPPLVDYPVTLLRTAPRPEGPWSDAKLLFIRKKDGQPAWADDGEGLFIHRGNPRAWRGFDGHFAPLPGDTFNREDPAADPFELTCASSFPSYCKSRVVQDVLNPSVGCCTRSDRCCDLAFTQGLGPSSGSSWASGNLYAQYLIPSFTQNFRTTDPSSQFPDKQRVFWTASTLNPYVVVLMSTDLSLRDWDHDGVPNDEDNCPLTFNDQSNCNEDAEEALESRRKPAKVARLGDACDPVPCPGAKMDIVRDTGGCRIGSKYSLGGCFGRRISDQLDFTPVGMGKRESLLDRPVTEPKAPARVPTIETHARFCQQNLDVIPPFDCNDPGIMTNDQLDLWPSAQAELADPARPWHRITLARRQCREIGGDFVCTTPTGFAPPPLPIGAPFDLDYGGSNEGATWLYDADYSFWRSGARVPDPSDAFKTRCNDAQYGQGTCLDGRLWLHAKTTRGSTTSYADTHAPNGELVGFHDVELSNHYVWVAPDEPVFTHYGGLRARAFFFKIFTLPDPPPVWRARLGTTLPLIRQDGGIFAVFDDGHREDVGFLASDSLRPKLLDASLVWVSPAEASPYVGGRDAPLALALSSDGTQVRSVVSRVGGTLYEHFSGCPINSDTCDFPGLRAATSPAGAAIAPSARTAFVSVYSREQGRLFVLGGRDAATGAVADDLWTYRIEDDAWTKLSLKGLVGEVMAATFSWRDGKLWIIARDPADASQRKTRLIAFEPTTGAFEIIASATTETPKPKYDFRGLFLDLDGNVGVFASSESAQKHRIALLTRRAGGYDVAMTSRRDRHLSAEPIVDFRGVALYYEPDRPPVDPSKDPDDDPEHDDRTRPARRLRRLPLRAVPASKLKELLR